MIISAKSSNTLQHNKELSELFARMSEYYQYLGPEQRFRANAYENVSKTLALMQDPIDEYADSIAHLDTLKGVGESIAEKIIEYLKTGKIKTYQQLKRKVPLEFLKLMDIEGIGPATIRQLHQQIGINTKDELIKAIKLRKLDGLKGYGTKKIEQLKRVLQITEVKQRIPFQEAITVANKVTETLKKINGIETVYIAGSVRRKKETIGDIDILCTTNITPRKKITEAIKKLSFIKRIIEAGPTRISFEIFDNPLQVDIRIVKPDQLGAALLYFTGSKEHNIQLRTLAKQKGWKINEYGVFDERTGKRIAGKTEKEIYTLMGFKFIPPEKRLGKNELLLTVNR